MDETILLNYLQGECNDEEAAIKQESGSWKWALFAACYTTALAWLVSFTVYQIGGLFV